MSEERLDLDVINARIEDIEMRLSRIEAQAIAWGYLKPADLIAARESHLEVMKEAKKPVT